MRKKAVVILMNGFEEIEAFSVIDILRRGGVDVVTVTPGGDKVNGAHDIITLVDKDLADIVSDEFDALILPGGQPGTNNLKANPRVIELVREFYKTGKIVSAICAAPSVLAVAGILDNKRATSYPGSLDGFDNVQKLDDLVVIDGNIITSRGPATAPLFAFVLLERLADKSIADKLKKGMLYTLL
jgi:4-methyl-5(b-hydroxyethyl)-thiazole monophosphate biosynthesis